MANGKRLTPEEVAAERARDRSRFVEEVGVAGRGTLSARLMTERIAGELVGKAQACADPADLLRLSREARAVLGTVSQGDPEAAKVAYDALAARLWDMVRDCGDARALARLSGEWRAVMDARAALAMRLYPRVPALTYAD
jgi:hypothetical protein